MKTYPITIPDDQAAVVDRILAEGHWDSIEDLFLYGLQQTTEELEQKAPPDVVAAVRIGLEQLARGELVDGQAVIDRCRAKLEAARKTSIASPLV